METTADDQEPAAVVDDATDLNKQRTQGQFITKKRSWQECKKKWNNSKQRAKQKIDNLRHPRTGGGPVQPQITPTEELILQGIGGRPSMTGVGSFLDTDAATPEISVEQDLEEANTSCEFTRSTPVPSGSNTTCTNTSGINIVNKYAFIYVVWRNGHLLNKKQQYDTI
ncbi:unnamed protein product [Mytilus coruscus]|uniref:Uncharacterized protein n=1 Tax=Mytilus coruscus TaxID=42192 RepID=A0A6J8DEM6_MYTCO|nr:unnamed protein product [Mytilus coruscus]